MSRRKRHAYPSPRSRPWLGSGSDGATSTALSTSPPLTFGTGTNLDVRLYVALGQDPNQNPDALIWTEVPQNYILWRSKIRIQRGRQPGQTRANPATMTLDLKDARGRHLWGLGTMMRLDVNPGTGAARRFTGQVVTRSPRSDGSGNDRWLQVACAGSLQRFGRGTAPAHSSTWVAVFDCFQSAGGGVEGGGRAYLGFWWPLEDAHGAESAASALLTGTPMTASGGVSFGTGTTAAGFLRTPDVTQGHLTGEAIDYTDPFGVQTMSFYVNASGTCQPVRWTSSSAFTHEWIVNLDTVTGFTLLVDGVAKASIPGATTLMDGAWHAINIAIDTIGFPGDTSIVVTLDDGALGAFDTVVGASDLGLMRNVTVNWGQLATLNGVCQLAGGAVFVFMGTTPLSGNDRDPALFRFVEVCNSESIPFEISGSGDGTVGLPDVNGRFELQEAMGPRGTQSPLALIYDVQDAEDGLLIETLEGKLRMLWHDERENQDVTLALTLGASGNAQILPPFEPARDDQRIFNDVTCSATNGTSFRDVETQLPQGVTGVGRYETQLTLNVSDNHGFGATSGGTAAHASFEAMRGTVNEPRFDSVTVELAKSPELIEAWLSRDPLGARVTLDNIDPTIWLWTADQLIEGYTEDITQKTWTVTMALSPAAPYRTFTVQSDDENLGRVDNPGSALVGTITDDATLTTIQVSSPGALWRTGPAAWPIAIAGEPPERVEVVSISGGSSPQTFTITRHAGKTVGHLSGASVTLWRPGVVALHSRGSVS